MYSLLIHSNSIVVVTSRQHIPVHNMAMCYINAHAGIDSPAQFCTVWGVYSVGVYTVRCVQCGECTVWGVYTTDTPTLCTLSDQNNCRLSTHTTCNASCTAHTTDTHSGASALGQ